MAEILPGLDKASQAFTKAHDAILKLLDGLVTFGYEAKLVANIIGGLTFLVVFIPSLAFGALFRAGAILAAAFLSAIDDVRQGSQDQLNQTTASALSDVLGIDIKASELPSVGSGGSNAALFQAIGAKVVGAITQELGGDNSSPAGPGEKAAQTFMGRGINFAMMSSIIALISETASVGFIKGFAEIGEEMQQTIGFGRLMRLVLQPLIHAQVTLPYTRETNAKYRPVHLNAAEYITALQAGRLSTADTNTALAQLGYSDDLIAELVAQRKHKLPAHVLDARVRWGKITRDEAVSVLVSYGMDTDTANSELDSIDLARADHEESAYAAEILKLAQQRMITSDVYSSLIQRLHFSPTQQQGWLNRLGVYLDSSVKRLTLGEMLSLLEHNLLTQSDIDNWAAQEGYNTDTAAMLELYLTEKTLDYQDAQKLKHDKAAFAEAQAKAKGKPVPPDVIHP